MNNPVLYMIGVGPGDPELLTYKAVRLIKECDCLFVPVKKKNSKHSLALKMVEKSLELANKKIVYLYFPMLKGEANMRPYFDLAANEVTSSLKAGQTGAFITIGCSTIYSTPGNLFKVLQGSGVETRFVPGVSSINASSAAAGCPLAYSEETLAVLPAIYTIGEVEETLEKFDRVVLMKAHTSLETIIRITRKKEVAANSFLVERATTNEEKVSPLTEIPEGYKPHYMSTVIIDCNGNKND